MIKKLIIGKSSHDIENFDVFVYCDKKVNSVKIPDLMEIISTYCFHKCQLNKVEFSTYSKLKIIDSHAFYRSKIEFISLPSELAHIMSVLFMIV